MTEKDIENRFTYHKPKEDKAYIFVDIRECAKNFANMINALVPDCRERSLAITKLEEVVMWANAGVSRN